MELKDVIHFYLYCDFVVQESDGAWLKDNAQIINSDVEEVWGRELECIPIGVARFILRSVDDICDFEFAAYNALRHTKPNKPLEGRYVIGQRDTPQSFAWLIKNRFDIFGLMQNGWAIDERRVKGMQIIAVTPTKYDI